MTEEEYDPAEDLERNKRELIGSLIDINATITRAGRKMASDTLKIRDALLEGAELCEVIARLHGEAARIAAQATGDIISTEWALDDSDEDDEEEIDEGIDGD